MKKGLISIGKMAAANHISIPTLRHYDEIGLLRPAYIDPETGYRYYSILQNARLDMIAYMKELGMNLGEIKGILEAEDLDRIESILGQKNEQIHEQMRELKSRHEAVSRAIASIERYRKSPVTGTISLEYIDQRYFWSIPCTFDFYAGDQSSYEEALVVLRRELLRAGIPYAHSYNVATSIRRSDIERGRFRPDQILIFSERPLDNYPGRSGVIESSMYACLYLDVFEEEIPCAQRLLQTCREKEYTIAGDYFCEVMSEFNVFDSTRRQMFIRLQIPVAFAANKHREK
ncbi:MAG: MerR family transcriptional regulator [Anaerovoracaceae bacterium]|jgi:DNA-binding transcriptional MerR regulator